MNLFLNLINEVEKERILGNADLMLTVRNGTRLVKAVFDHTEDRDYNAAFESGLLNGGHMSDAAVE